MPVPKYLEISNQLAERIKSGELAPGTRAPSENELIRDHHVSNTTARRALANLERLGFATRIKGRGTFVRQPAVERSATKILSFSQNMRQAGRVPSTKVLAAKRITRGRRIVVEGRRYQLAAPVFCILRLRFGDDEPILLEERFISSELCPGFLRTDLSGSLYNIYHDTYGLDLTEIKQRLSSVLLDATARSHFGLEVDTPGFLIEGVTFAGKEMVLEIERSIYRGDTYQFTVTATG